MFHTAAEAQSTLAKEHLQMELEMEHKVLAPFHQILEVSMPVEVIKSSPSKFLMKP